MDQEIKEYFALRVNPCDLMGIGQHCGWPIQGEGREEHAKEGNSFRLLIPSNQREIYREE
jgi:hypothetical protein